MPCIPIPSGGFVCTNHWGRLKLGNKYVWVEFHRYCGPIFWKDQNATNEYVPKDEHDPIWPLFEKWIDKRGL